jgi:hypothetical protein
MMVLVSCILFFAVLGLFLALHFRRWLQTRGVNHKRTALIRCACLLPSTAGFTMASPGQHFWVFILAAFMQAFVFWVLFDGFYNRLRGFKWWYGGGHNDPTEKDDSILDQFISSTNGFLGQIIKLAGCGITITVYIITLFL